MKAVDITGTRYGHLVGLEFVRSEAGRRMWEFACDCGARCVRAAASVRYGRIKSCGCRRGRDWEAAVGSRYNHLTIINYIGKREERHWYTMDCDCGQRITEAIHRVKNGHKKSCGCAARASRPNTRRLGYGIAARNSVLAAYKYGATTRKIEWRLSDAEAIALFDGRCFYCGVHPSNTARRRGTHGEFRYNGIDRMDNDRGYESGNVCSCCGECNYLKSNKTLEEFMEWIARTVEFWRGDMDTSNTIEHAERAGKLAGVVDA
jgi:hypothetical protein